MIASILAGMTFSYLIFEITNNAALMSLMGVIASLPTILIILFAGVIIDRMDQRKMILISIIIRFVVFAIFLLCFVLKDFLIQEYSYYEPIATGGYIKVHEFNYIHFIWPLYLALFVSNAGGALYGVTVSTYSKYIVKRNDLLVANSFNSTVTQVASVIGPLLAGALINFSYFYSFLISVCIMSLAVIASLFLMLKGIETPKVELENVKGFKKQMNKVFVDIRVGMGAIRNEPKILFLTITYVIFNFITCFINGSSYTAILQGEMELNATWLGAISATMSAIAVISTLVIMKIGKIDRKLILVILFLIMETIGLFIFAFNRNPWIVIFVNVIPFGIVNGMANIPSNTLRQEKIPHEKLGRVMSSVLLFISMANLLGNGLITLVGNKFAPMYMVLTGAILCALLTIVSLVLLLSKSSLRCSDYEGTVISEEKEEEEIEILPSNDIKDADLIIEKSKAKYPLDDPAPAVSLD